MNPDPVGAPGLQPDVHRPGRWRSDDLTVGELEFEQIERRKGESLIGRVPFLRSFTERGERCAEIESRTLDPERLDDRHVAQESSPPHDAAGSGNHEEWRPRFGGGQFQADDLDLAARQAQLKVPGTNPDTGARLDGFGNATKDQLANGTVSQSDRDGRGDDDSQDDNENHQPLADTPPPTASGLLSGGQIRDSVEVLPRLPIILGGMWLSLRSLGPRR